jgi:hypothetical protein
MKTITGVIGFIVLMLLVWLWHRPGQPKGIAPTLDASHTAPTAIAAIQPLQASASRPIISITQSNAGSKDVAELCLPPAIAVEIIKAAMDKSMTDIGASYFAHRQIRQPGGTPSVSFVYYRGASPGTLPTFEELNALRQAQQTDPASLSPEKFICVDAGTSSNAPPVCMYQEGLPDWIQNEKKALALGLRHLGPDARLTDTTRLALGAHCFYTFTDPAGRIAHVDVDRMTVFEGWNLTPRPAPEGNPVPAALQARNERVRAQWGEFLTVGINFNQFSLAKLTDLSRRNTPPANQ